MNAVARCECEAWIRSRAAQELAMKKRFHARRNPEISVNIPWPYLLHQIKEWSAYIYFWFELGIHNAMNEEGLGLNVQDLNLETCLMHVWAVQRSGIVWLIRLYKLILEWPLIYCQLQLLQERAKSKNERNIWKSMLEEVKEYLRVFEGPKWGLAERKFPNTWPKL